MTIEQGNIMNILTQNHVRNWLRVCQVWRWHFNHKQEHKKRYKQHAGIYNLLKPTGDVMHQQV